MGNAESTVGRFPFPWLDTIRRRPARPKSSGQEPSVLPKGLDCAGGGLVLKNKTLFSGLRDGIPAVSTNPMDLDGGRGKPVEPLPSIHNK